MTRENEPARPYAVSEETMKSRAAQHRRRLLAGGPLAIGLVVVAVSKGGGWDLWIVGILIALVIVGVMLNKAFNRQKNLPPGVLWRGNAGMELDDFRASPSLGAYAPDSAGAAFLLRTNIAFGFLTLGEDWIAWEPDRTTRKVGAREWRIPRSTVVAAEMGELPGLPSLTRFLKKVNEGLTLWFEDGTSVSFVVTWATGMDTALARMGIPGRTALRSS